MADEKLSARIETTLISGGFMYIILPDGGGGWGSYKISTANLLAAVNSSISSLQTYQNQAVQTVKQKNQSANYSFALGTDVALENIDFVHVSGTVTIKVGTSPGTSDILPEQTFTSGSLRNTVPKYWAASITLYFTISSGTTDVIINYRQNYNS
jgi:hypothetical protein